MVGKPTKNNGEPKLAIVLENEKLQTGVAAGGWEELPCRGCSAGAALPTDNGFTGGSGSGQGRVAGTGQYPQFAVHFRTDVPDGDFNRSIINSDHLDVRS